MEGNRPKVSPGLMAREPRKLERVGYGVYRDPSGNLTTSRGRLLRRAGEGRAESPAPARQMPAINPSQLAQSLASYNPDRQMPQQPQQQMPQQQMPQPQMPQMAPTPPMQGGAAQPGQGQFDPDMMAKFFQFLQQYRKG